MALFGRNNLGHFAVQFRLKPYQTRRQAKKVLKGILGKKYPIKVDVILDTLSVNSGVTLMVNQRGFDKAETHYGNRFLVFDDLKDEYWSIREREHEGIALDYQIWYRLHGQFGKNCSLPKPKRTG